jgi:hypothetical protein
MNVDENWLTPESNVLDKKLVFPKLYYPFPDGMHPDVEDVEEECVRWAIDFELICSGGKNETLYRNIRNAECIGRLYPDMTREGFLATSIWGGWLFFIDDYFCEAGAFKKAPADLALLHLWLRQIMCDPGGYDWRPLSGEIARKLPKWGIELMPKIGRATADMARRFQEISRPGQYMRWVDGMTYWYLATVWQCQMGVYDEHVPSVQQYLLGREGVVGVIPSCALLDMVAGYEVSESDFYQEDVRRLQRLGALAMALCNDLFSLPRDMGVLWSLPTILMAQGMQPQEAANETARIHNRFVCEYLDIEKRVKTWAGPELLRFLHAMDAFIRGHYERGRRQKRYMVTANYSFDLNYDVACGEIL